MKRLRITRGGQVSVPAEIRHRWGGSTLTLEDLGDHVVLRPAPDDLITATRGSLKDLDASSEELRRAARDEELAAGERRDVGG